MLTVDQLREHVTSSLSDDALQLRLDAAYEAIDAYAGSDGPVTELVDGGHRYITLSRPADEITSIVEDYSSDTPDTMAADDYLVHPGGYVIERLSGGTLSRHTWHHRVFVTYHPVGTDATRDLVAIDLVNFDLTMQAGLTMEQVGAWTRQYGQAKTFDQLHDEILGRLSSVPSLVVV